MLQKPIMLSVFVPTYNHEEYIKQALDSIRMQETDYDYEVLVGDDCSTDSTRDILEKYEKTHPDFMTVFYREHNMFKEPVTNSQDLKYRCRGKYVIALEGDDCWIDKHKIQKQIEFLESHPDYSAVAHNCVVVDQNSVPNGERYPECHDYEYTYQHFMSGILPGQLATVMYRNIYADTHVRQSIFTKNLIPGDQILYFILLSLGRVYCIQETMSAYRHVTTSGPSYSANYVKSYARDLAWAEALFNYSMQNLGEMSIKYARMILVRYGIQNLFKGEHRKESLRLFMNMGFSMSDFKDYLYYKKAKRFGLKYWVYR